MSAADLRNRLLECLGGPFPPPCPLRPQLRETIRKEGYRIESVTYEVEPNDRVPAMLLVPDGVDAAHPAPPSPSGTSTTASGIWGRPSRPDWPATRCTTPA